MRAQRFWIWAIVVAVLTAPAALHAQAPVGTAFTYQAQLKQAGVPLNDTADFEFTLWDDPTSTDPSHQVGPMVPVDNKDVVGGLFTVVLDFGVIPFTTNEARWLEIAVRSPSGSGDFTTLEPRHALTATPFSLATRGINVDAVGNVGIGTPSPAARLDVLGTALVEGETPAEGPAMRITNLGQGEAVLGTHEQSGNFGRLGGPNIGAYGRNGNGNFGYLGGSQAAVYGEAADGSFGALASAEDGRRAVVGVVGKGWRAGGHFYDKDEDDSGDAYVGYGQKGIEASGYGCGGYFYDSGGSEDSGEAYIARGDYGIEAWGHECGGYFAYMEGATTLYARIADSDGGGYGIKAFGPEAGGYFADSVVDPTRYAYIARGSYGIEAFGPFAGGFFKDAAESGVALVGYGNFGIDARGDTSGGYFKDSDDSGQAYLGHGELGIKATGNEMGGHFKNTTPGTSVEAKLAYTDAVHTYGVKAEGGWYGISASGNVIGGEFERADARSHAKVATYDYGIWAYGAHNGGYFENTGNSNSVSLAGETRAGFFYNPSSGNVVRLAGQTWAGNFTGDVKVDGDFEVTGTKSFRIDHPLDPANKYLVHSCIESPDRMNVYNGNVVLDENGEAWVQLPDWFEALNRDFRYQLTCIGGFAPVYVAEKIADNCFKIAGGEPGMEVSWQVTGIRQDPYAEAHPITVEEEKPENERGKYLHPALYGEPETKTIGYDERPGRVGR